MDGCSRATEAFCGALEEVFGGFSAELEGMRKAAGEVGDFDVEKRTADFKGIHHAGAVGFREDAVLQIDFGVELKGAVNRVGGCAGFPRLDGLAVDFLDGES